jgi:hypothetical protein
VSEEEPKRLHDVPLVDITIVGKLFAIHGDSVVFLEMPGYELTYLPLFDSKEELESILTQLKVEWDGIKRISNAREFMESLAIDNVAPICNIRFLDNGRIRWKQLVMTANGDVGEN